MATRLARADTIPSTLGGEQELEVDVSQEVV